LAFPSTRGQRLSRNGVDYILKQAAAGANCSSLKAKRIHPHAIRHTTGSHLLESGVDISVIALWLGHESVQTTHVYVEVDLAAKQRALSKLEPVGTNARRYKPQDQVLAFLATLSLALCAVGCTAANAPAQSFRFFDRFTELSFGCWLSRR
jgi:integrase/recombinase XerD